MKKEKLILVRKSKKISQADVATYLKMSQTQYQRRESGKTKINHNDWQRIATLLSVNIEDIYEADLASSNTKNTIEEISILKNRIIILEQKIESLIDFWEIFNKK